MGVAQGDLIQLIDRQLYLEQEVLNVYYYRYILVTGATNDIYPALADWFEDNVIAAVVQVQVDVLEHVNIEIKNLTNGLDIYDRAITIPGDIAELSSAWEPSYVSINFKLVRESLVTRNGNKRIGGLGESSIQGNTYLFPTGAQAAIETALAADVVIGAVTTFEPIIVKRPISSPPVASYQYSSIGDAQFTRLGTQNTRKHST